MSADTLPDGRVDHRGHERDDHASGYGWICLTCSDEDAPDVDWTIPYDTSGRPIPEDWRLLTLANVRSLCGMTRPRPTLAELLANRPEVAHIGPFAFVLGLAVMGA